MYLGYHASFEKKRGSRHAAHAAKALRWRVDQLTKMSKKKYFSPRNGVLTDLNINV